MEVRTMNTEQEKDFDILKAVYFGNHLNDDETERAYKLIYLLTNELKHRVGSEKILKRLER